MKISFYERFIAWLTLISGLSISGVAVYYSVAGLVSIFSASVVPIIIMGVTLELSKLVATVWLKQNWSIAPAIIKLYLFLAVVVLMAITSMGIFGYLSKAHLDQAVPSSIIIDQISVIDSKINTFKENINDARKALAQMDSTVDQTIARSTSEAGAGRAASLRKSQNKERVVLHSAIEKAQSEISQLTTEKIPLTQEIKKAEAEVGPIKYIAALIYGDDITENLLERAVRWVIILIVFIFDPLAVALLLASQYSFAYFRKSINPIVQKVEVTKPLPRQYNPTPLVDYNYSFSFSDQKNENTINDHDNNTIPDVIDTKIPISPEEIKKNLTETEKEAKRKFKQSNPRETIHSLERKKQLGLINQLPWESNDI